MWLMNACNNTVNLITTHPFNGPFSGTTRVGQYQKGKTNLDFTEAKDIEWQWHQLGYVQVCTSLQTDNHASTPPLSFLQAGCPSCRPTNTVKALKARQSDHHLLIFSVYYKSLCFPYLNADFINLFIVSSLSGTVFIVKW